MGTVHRRNSRFLSDLVDVEVVVGRARGQVGARDDGCSTTPPVSRLPRLLTPLHHAPFGQI